MAKRHRDEPCFRDHVALCHPSDSSLADHAHRFDAFESSPGTLKRAVALCQPGPLFTVEVLFDDIVEILALAQTNSTGKCTLGFQGFHRGRIGWVLIHVDAPAEWDWQDELNTFSKKRLAPAVSRFAESRKSMRLPGRIHSAVQILVWPLHLYIGFVDTVAFVRALEM